MKLEYFQYNILEVVNIDVLQKVEIENLIYEVRGKQVILDSDLARLYEVETKYLNRQMKRNIERFPDDFCFRLTKEEYYRILRCQFDMNPISWTIEMRFLYEKIKQ